MTCHFRHLQQTFKKVGIIINSGNEREFDKAIHQLLGVKYKNYPRASREVKKRFADYESGFASRLKRAMSIKQ